jgi:drug/metabolite transporter (DMT)-like permease
MNWRRILVSAVSLWAATMAAALPFRFLHGWLRGAEDVPAPWFQAAAVVAMGIATFFIFVGIGVMQIRLPVVHGVLIVALAWLLAAPVDLLILGDSRQGWLIVRGVLVAVAAVGLAGGILLRPVLPASSWRP